jgi:transposase-like protein
MKKDGHTRRGTQRWTCLAAGCPDFDKPRIDFNGWSTGGNYLPSTIRDDVRELLLDGGEVRRIARIMKISKNSVRRIKKELVSAGADLRCPCGRSANHNGWCVERYRRSPARQEFMKNWNNRKKY